MHAIGQKRCTPLALFAFVPFFTGCGLFSTKVPTKPAPAVLSAGALLPSPRLIVGRVIAVDESRRLAFVELAPDAPQAALVDGTELSVRTLSLRDTARLQTSPYVRGRTLGAKIMAGQPSPGDEVVWLAP